jgi:hypothetical protein
MPNFIIMEWFRYCRDGRNAIVTEPCEAKVAAGRLAAPSGLGIDRNLDHLDRFPRFAAR